MSPLHEVQRNRRSPEMIEASNRIMLALMAGDCHGHSRFNEKRGKVEQSWCSGYLIYPGFLNIDPTGYLIEPDREKVRNRKWSGLF